MVTSFETNGNLKAYLREINDQGKYVNVSSNSKLLKDLDMAEQITDGMMYLQELPEVRHSQNQIKF